MGDPAAHVTSINESSGQGRSPAPEPRREALPFMVPSLGPPCTGANPGPPITAQGAKFVSSLSLPQQSGAWGVPLVSKNTPLLSVNDSLKATTIPLSRAMIRVITFLLVIAINNNHEHNCCRKPVEPLLWDCRGPGAHGQHPSPPCGLEGLQNHEPASLIPDPRESWTIGAERDGPYHL